MKNELGGLFGNVDLQWHGDPEPEPTPEPAPEPGPEPTALTKEDVEKMIQSASDKVRTEYSTKLNYTEQKLSEIIIEQVKSRIVSKDHTEIRIPKKRF